jgi:hypothetical protein
MATPASDVETMNPAVFIQDFVDVNLPEKLVSERLSEGQGWLARLASAAGDDTESQLVKLGPSSFGHLIARDVRVRLGRATSGAAGVVVPVRWEDARRPGLFPLLDGNLEVAPLGPDHSRVVLYASYRPPFDAMGRVLDQALFHRVAESTVRSFLQKVAGTLQNWP